jgi:nitrite reductase/ring-hydroxylating ferredoxin subunit/uncharacterized membrane protein
MRSPHLLERAVDRIETADGLDSPAKTVAAAVGPVVQRDPLRDLLSGTRLGHPLHPLLVAAPTGCWVSALLVDMTGANAVVARRLVGAGLLAAVPTVAAGLTDWTYTEGSERRVGLVHAAANAGAVALFGLSWLRRGRGHGGRCLSALGAACLVAGGYLGGHLSYAIGVGVDTTAFSTIPKEWTDLDELPGGMVLVDGSAGEMFALADRCTHRGAPLSGGTIAEGCVECPWHGSRFALADGSVVRGPATRPQPVYEIRESGGRVQVRGAEKRALRSNPVGSGA